LDYFFYHAATALVGQGLLIVEDSWSHSVRYTTLRRTSRDEWSAQHNTHKRQTTTSPVGFEPTIPTSERLQTHALDCMATGIGKLDYIGTNKMSENRW